MSKQDTGTSDQSSSIVVFLMSQFNVHYLSWLKNEDHLSRFWQRFTPFYDLLRTLPEFDEFPDSLQEPEKEMIREAIRQAMCYKRKLLIDISNVSGEQYYFPGKRFKVLLADNSNDNNDVSSTGEDGGEMEDDETSLPKDHKGRLVLGEIELKNNAKGHFVFPLYTNRIKSDMQIHLVLIDRDDSEDSSSTSTTTTKPANEYHKIVVSEADISGFKGYHKQEQFEISDEEHISLSVILDLTLSWQIDPASFELVLPQPVAIVRKLSGVLFHLGNYYWHFLRDFYRWAAAESVDADTRYCAIQMFHELSCCLPPKAHCEDMAPIFVKMYDGLYPSVELLTTSLANEEDYVEECVSMVDNIIFVFPYLSFTSQITCLTRIQPFMATVLKSRFHYAKRLVALVSNELGNYEQDQVQEVVLPFAIKALYYLATVRSPADSFSDPRTPNLDWKSVQSLASLLVRLVVDCVELLKPMSWTIAPLWDPEMAPVRRCLSLLIRSLFNRTTVGFLQAIYLALNEHNVLDQQHLASFITQTRLQMVKQWAAESNSIVIDDEPEEQLNETSE